ncbi:carboxypeptidase-like regulatory domain-containing protein [Fibrella aquatica]|uniref:carboxypeptidase-like regulatory domain-containing protein n=1 Tax=Fibrella aquatica TaxID=3242487 RepID=UPI003520A462
MNVKALSVLLLISQFVLIGRAWAQGPGPIVGRVFDGETNQPVPFASVYVNASTRGTTANAEGQYQLTGVPSGSVELVASAVGYETVRQLIRLGDVKNRRVNFMLKTDAIGLKSVTVTAKRSAAYNRMLKQFKRELLGVNPSADKCEIINAGVVSLTMNDGHLQATASEPLVIENKALGYRLTYQLLYFDSYRSATYYGGASRFEALTSQNSEQGDRWERNRQRVYLGSGRHLLATLQTGTYEREGFLVFESNFALSSDPAVPIARFSNEPPSKSVSADSLFTPAELPTERLFYSSKPLEVFYTRQRALTPYKGFPYAYSLVYMPKGPATVTTDGWVVHPNGMEMRGALSNDRLATLLPADWQPAIKELPLLASVPKQGIVLPTDAFTDSVAVSWKRRQTNQAPAVFLHIDKGTYATGDRLQFSVFMLDSKTQLPIDNPVVDEELPLHIELIAPDGRQRVHQWVRTQAGRTSGSFRLSDSLASGSYRLLAYTEADRGNVRPAFEQRVSIINASNVGNGLSTTMAKPIRPLVDVQFLPEGGRWVAGLPTRMGIKAVDQRGRGVLITGRILSDQQAEVGRFTTNAFGMGSIDLVPQANRTYLAQVRWATDSALITLPAVDSVGLVLATDMVTDSATLSIRVCASATLASQPVYLVIQSRGTLVQQTKIQLQHGAASLFIPAAKLPVGVAQVTLMNALGQPQAERLVFIPERLLPTVADVSTDKPTYLPRESVTLSVRIADGFGDQLAIVGSAAVTDAQQVPTDSIEATLITHLLLTGELRGRVEAPNQYLTSNGISARRAIDDLLLTQGWRRINWRVEPGKPMLPASSVPGMVVSGTVFDKRNRPLTGANLLLTFSNKAENTFARTTRSDTQGRFTIDNLSLTDTALVQVRPMTAAFKTIADTRVVLDAPGRLFAFTDTASGLDLTTLKPTIALMQQRQASDPEQYRDKDVRQLKEIVVRARRPDDDRQARRFSLHGAADATVVFDENARSFANAYDMMIGRVPGVQVRRRTLSDPGGMSGGYTVTMRGPSSLGQNLAPLYVIDGVSMDENGDGTALYMLNPAEIERIEVLKNSGGAMYGARGGAGVIAFFSKKETANQPVEAGKGEPELFVNGFQTDRTFYTPRYSSLPDSNATNVPDRRDVLYWKPDMATSLSGFSTLKFPLTDMVRTLRLTIQGITTDGRPIFIHRLINVR